MDLPIPEWERALAAWERDRPFDWTSPFERTVWALTLSDRIFAVYAEPYNKLRDSRTPKYRDIARQMFENLEKLNRVFTIAGVDEVQDWQRRTFPYPPWRRREPPALTWGDLGAQVDLYAPWPPLRWESQADLERWYWRLDGLCEYLAALALRAYPDEESEQRLRVEWAATRLKSLLVRARPRWPWGEVRGIVDCKRTAKGSRATREARSRARSRGEGRRVGGAGFAETVACAVAGRGFAAEGRVRGSRARSRARSRGRGGGFGVRVRGHEDGRVRGDGQRIGADGGRAPTRRRQPVPLLPEPSPSGRARARDRLREPSGREPSPLWPRTVRLCP